MTKQPQRLPIYLSYNEESATSFIINIADNEGLMGNLLRPEGFDPRPFLIFFLTLYS